MSQQSPQQLPPPSKSYFEKYKRFIFVSFAIIIVMVILFFPFIPIQYTVAKTRTVKLQYSSEVYGYTIGYFIPKIVNVTNKDSIGGIFSVTMKMWQNNPVGQPQLLDTFTNSSFINAGTTHTFHLPDDWIIIELMYAFTYSVSAPSKQENYNVINTEYKSIIDLIRGA